MKLNGKNRKMALILRYFTEFGSVRGALPKVVDKAITMDNLRLLCLVINVRRRPRYKYFITAMWKFCSRFINSRLNAQYLPSSNLLKEVSSLFLYFEVRVRYRRKKVTFAISSPDEFLSVLA